MKLLLGVSDLTYVHLKFSSYLIYLKQIEFQ